MRDVVVRALGEAARAGTLRRAARPETLADALLVHWTGALALWSSGHPVDFDRERAFVMRALVEPLREERRKRRRR